MPPQDRHIRNVLKLFDAHCYRHDRYTLFSDCMELIAISIANSVDSRCRGTREARYLEIVGRYDGPTVEMFPRVFAEITMALEEAPGDVLGSIFTALEIHNKHRGQFFTPYSVCQMMAEVTLGDASAARALIEDKGFVSTMEPACGAGAMVIALAEALRAAEINYQRQLHVTAIDIDQRAVHMSEYVDAHLHEPITLDELASVAGFSRSHFSRSFKATTGQGPYRFVTSRRIGRARELLEVGGVLSIGAIAQAVGFASASVFRRAFHQAVGMTPQQYRKERR